MAQAPVQGAARGVLTAPQFDDLVRGVIDTALDGIAKLAPDASVIVEKSPSHSFCANLLAQHAPEARVVHLVRDGRDVAASLMAAGDGWGRGWAPRDLKGAARSWVQHVDGVAAVPASSGSCTARSATSRWSPATSEVLREIHEFCGLPIDDAEAARRYEQLRAGVDGRRRGRPDPDRRRVRRGGGGPQRAGRLLRRRAARGLAGVVERGRPAAVPGRSPVATLEKLGYEPDGRWAASRSGACGTAPRWRPSAGVAGGGPTGRPAGAARR